MHEGARTPHLKVAVIYPGDSPQKGIVFVIGFRYYFAVERRGMLNILLLRRGRFVHEKTKNPLQMATK